MIWWIVLGAAGFAFASFCGWFSREIRNAPLIDEETWGLPRCPDEIPGWMMEEIRR